MNARVEALPVNPVTNNIRDAPTAGVESTSAMSEQDQLLEQSVREAQLLQMLQQQRPTGQEDKAREPLIAVVQGMLLLAFANYKASLKYKTPSHNRRSFL